MAITMYGCSTKQEENKVADITSLEVYRYNFIDDGCEDCIPVMHSTNIKVETLLKKKYLVYESSDKQKMNQIHTLFETAKQVIGKPDQMDNSFMLVFRKDDGTKDVYSRYPDNVWRLNDSILVHPDVDVVSVLKKVSGIQDFTDYETVSK